MWSLLDREGPDFDGERGGALLVVVLILFVIATLGVASSRVASTEVEVAANYRQSWAAFYAADGAAQASFADLITVARGRGDFPEQVDLDAILSDTVRGASIVNRTMGPTEAAVRAPLQTGFFQGLVANTRPYEVVLTAETDSYPRGEAGVTMGMYFDIIPIFQFAVFYEDDLELLPGPAMTLSGRLHSNSDIYLGAGNSLTVDSNVTSAGDIYHSRKDTNSRPGGGVNLRDGQGAFPGMAGLDSRHADWTDDSLSRWRGNVRSRDHGVERLNLTISDPTNPHMIIEPGYDSDTPADRTSKLYYGAEMSINVVNGNGFDRDGNPLDVTQALAFDILYDQREKKHMLIVEVDVSRLPMIPGFPSAPAPATVYIGSFEPVNGVPDWDLSQPGAEESYADFYAWLEQNFGGGRGLPTALKDAGKALQNALDACATVPDTVSRGGRTRPGHDPDPAAAAAAVETAIEHLESAKKEKLITKDQLQMLGAMIAPTGACESQEPGTNWPAEWEGYDKPYESPATEYAVKIYGGRELSQPLTIITGNPAYVKGDYNRVKKKPAAVIADAITILSNDWGDDDLTYSQLSLGDRRATTTRQNVAYMLGNTETKTGSYNGGVENLPRFLEDWSGRTFRYRGSLIDVWYANNAPGKWKYGSPVYKAPIRDWEFDTDLLDPDKMPPSTPKVYTVRLKAWSRH